MIRRFFTLVSLSVLLLMSCSREYVDPNNSSNIEDGQNGVVAEFSLEATQQDDVARALNFTVGNNGALTVDAPQEVPVLLILRNSKGNETVFDTKWQRKAVGRGYVLSLGASSPVKLTLPKGSSLSSNDLYVSAVLGANKQMYTNKRLMLSNTFNVSAQVLTESQIGHQFTLSIPYILPWTKVTPINRGTFIGFSFETNKTNTFLMQGAILRVQIQNKQSNPVTLKRLQIISNVLGNSGHFDWSANPRAGVVPPFTFDGMQTTNLNFVASTQVAANKESGLFYFWTMPQVQPQPRSTKIVAVFDGSQGEASIELANTSVQISSKSNFRVPGVIEQIKPLEDPNNPLSWIAEYNLSNTPGIFATTHANTFSTKAIESDGRTRASGYYTFDETQTTRMPSGYHVPSYWEISAIFPPHLVINPANNTIQEYTYRIMHDYPNRNLDAPLFHVLSHIARFFPDRDEQVDIHPQELIMVKGSLITPAAVYYTPNKGMSSSFPDKSPKSNVVHARRFIDTEYESLWRYEYIDNPWSSGKMLKVTCRLAKGTSNEVLKSLPDTFWATNNSKDVVRYFPALGTITAQDAEFALLGEGDDSFVNRTDIPRLHGSTASFWTATRKPEFGNFPPEFEKLFSSANVVGGVYGFSFFKVASSVSVYRHKYNIRPMKNNP